MPNRRAPKMDDAQACHLEFAGTEAKVLRRGTWGARGEALPQGGVERAPVQILVVVANIQARALKTEVGKGSVSTAIGHGLVGPKPRANAHMQSRCRSGLRRPPRGAPPGPTGCGKREAG